MTLLRDAYLSIDRIRKKDELAISIQNPKVPPILSESLCVHLIGAPHLSSLRLHNPRLGGKASDIIANDSDGAEQKIEVKATANVAFSELGVKDIQADYLIWIHFDNYFIDESQHLRAIILKSPGQFFSKRNKINLAKFLQETVNYSFEVEFSIRALRDTDVL